MKSRKSTGRDHLFQLIKSLSKSEKRHFILFSGGDRNTLYMKIFYLISAQKQYDEAEVKHALKDYDATNNFHVAKKYLFEILMDSLIIYHRDYSVNFKLKRMLLQIELLNSKGLYEVSYNVLKRAESIASEHERHIYLQEIYQLQKLNLLDLIHKGYSENDLSNIERKESSAIYNSQNIEFYRTAITELFSEYVRGEGIRNPKKNKVFKRIEAEDMFLNENKAISAESKLLLFNIKGYYYYELAQYEKSIGYRDKVISLLEKNENLRRVFDRNYLIAIHNYNNDLRMLGRFDEMKDNIEKFKSIKANDFRNEAEQFRRYYIMKTEFIMDTGRFEEVLSVEKEFHQLLSKYSKTISSTIIRMINYYIARCYFGAGMYDESIIRFLKIINEPKSERESAVYGSSQIWMLLAHFELGNHRILPYLSKSAQRYFRKNKILFANENRILDFFSSEKKTIPSALQERLSDLKTFIQKNTNPLDDKSMFYTSLVDWLESKISNRHMSVVIKERIKIRKTKI